jgi:4'-phosphopantetheinyl transferase
MKKEAVDLWRVPLHCAFDKNILSPDEIERASRFLLPLLHDRYCAGRCALRVILSTYLHAAPQAIKFSYNENGKPLVDDKFNFNLSHAGGQMLVGVTQGRMLGVDIETRDRRTESESIARRFLSSHEVEQLLQFPIDERGAAFLRCWVRKEAYVKALGTGIGGGLQNFSVSLADCAVTSLLWPGDAAGWTFYDVEMGPEFIASVALTSNPCELRVFDYQSPFTFQPDR